jgi:hypothetical protein
VVDDALEVAAVVVAPLRAVVEAGRLARVVVRAVAVREPVGHDEVDHVVRREAPEAALAVERLGDAEVRVRRPGGGGHTQQTPARIRAPVDEHVHEGVGARVVDAHEAGPDALPDGLDARAAEVLPAQHDAHGVDGMVRPPVRRLDLRHRRRRLRRAERCGRANEYEGEDETRG